jgi:hypothetical protein
LADDAICREIMDNLETTAPTITLWKRRYQEEGILGLETIRPGQRPQKLTPVLRAKILAKTEQGATGRQQHWILRKRQQLLVWQGTDPQGMDGSRPKASPSGALRASDDPAAKERPLRSSDYT